MFFFKLNLLFKLVKTQEWIVVSDYFFSSALLWIRLFFKTCKIT